MKKFISLLLTLAVLLSLAACGAQDDNNGSTTVSSTGQTVETTQSSDPPSADMDPSLPSEVQPDTDNTEVTQPSSEPDTDVIVPSTSPSVPEEPTKPSEPEVPTITVPTPAPEVPVLPTAPSGATQCGHNYTLSGSVASTCTVAGYQTYTCTKCGSSYQKMIAAAGHRYTEATCLAPKTCSVCMGTEGNPLGHSYAGGSCTRCGTADPNYNEETGPATITVFLKGNDGTKLSNVTVTLYTSDTASLLGSAVSDSAGYATITLDCHPGSYRVILSNVPKGYLAKDSYTFSANRANITLSAVAVIDPEDHSKAQYAVGKTMGDFTVTDTDGNTYTLSQLLKEKKLVILNFWYYTCSPCKAEFPYFEALYQEYQDEIEILAMNHFDGEASIQSLKAQMGLTFPMIQESLGMQQGFNITTYPTTVIISSGGTILHIKREGYASEDELRTVIESMLGS